VSPRSPRAAGFTIIEMLIVVVMLGILAALAVVGFRRYIGRARSTEAVAVLSEMASKEQVYFLEFGNYLPLRADNNMTLPSPDEATAAFYPSDPSSSAFESSRTATSIASPSGWPKGWQGVGLRPRNTVLYCTYLVNAGATGQAVPAGATLGQTIIGTVGATGPAWFYGVAACNLTGPAGFPNEDTVLGVSSASPAMITLNDGR
jgi:prepilin-type N-terminal cleavage/methylation domain-containing protein